MAPELEDDKTGTLTRGLPEVEQVIGDGMGEAELLHLAAAVEAESEHPPWPSRRRTWC